MMGWRCPACNSAHAPDVKTCPSVMPMPVYPWTPTYPGWPQPQGVPGDVTITYLGGVGVG